ncbi:MAG TPA: glutathione S-transferase family protein [Casimicrobiaceae bacterium]|jgi:GST-like protein|nr:glutathione S-transferase family protein [Casimicrobiaceae bacterium]
MIELYAANSSNSQRVAIMLEECALPYSVRRVDLGKGEQRSEAFLAINPAGAVPAIVDSDGPGGATALTQSGAILLYLAMKTGRYFPQDPARRVRAFEWFMFAASDWSSFSTMLFLNTVILPDKSQANGAFYEERLGRYFRVANERLAAREFLADELSIADFALYPVVRVRYALVEKAADLPHLSRWAETLAARPTVERAMAAVG